MPELCTIGYESYTQPELIARLREAGVEVLIDVRAVASSRKAGFSKTLLAGGLVEAGIEYVHLRGLGTPKPGREAARAGRVAEMQAIYEEQLKSPEAEHDMARAEAIVAERPAALLCLEADAAICHRRIVADRLRERLGIAVRDL
jgi:uncharacterized protein (DUF488 family)